MVRVSLHKKVSLRCFMGVSSRVSIYYRKRKRRIVKSHLVFLDLMCNCHVRSSFNAVVLC